MTSLRTVRRAAGVVAGALLVSGSLVACSGGGGSSDGTVHISYLTQNDPNTVESAHKIIAAFEKKYPKISVKLDSQPPGSEGDNLVKTKLSTGEMDDVFFYNTGSLLQAIRPDQTLVDLSDQSWMKQVTNDFKSTIKSGKGMYGAPLGTSFAGGILYNKKVYRKLGLSVPTSWAQFMANSQKIRSEAPGVTPVIQAYGDDYTAQIWLLADFANVARQDSGWAAKYTKNQVKFTAPPAFEGFAHQEEAAKAGLFNKDFASINNDKALKLLAEGNGAQYPILTNSVATIAQNSPKMVDDIGYFAMPADNPAYTAATIWQPNALYIPRNTKGDKLKAAKSFVAFAAASPEACAIANEVGVPTGPYVTTACKLTGDVPPAIKDVQKYFDQGKTAPALEFLSPVKGPNLPAITVQVGSGITTAAKGAKLYDEDVKKQAQQLNLPGW
jgi:raffinose/stachyose/melibiose transport system substrate-binding protein